MRAVAEEQPEGQKYCAAQTIDVTGESGENVYDERHNSLDSPESYGEGMGRNLTGNDRTHPQEFPKEIGPCIEAQAAYLECDE
ncbi:unnamed protein product [Heligmosomoides polygyrus]|uniref:Uncharacterized protein n=1 Tax=Heligmosomoides polygyrus TaxID=6339 RepID=A0A183G485_HELPZ|nr:unnamed protein product [Heligmosomoides polygyrus]